MKKSEKTKKTKNKNRNQDLNSKGIIKKTSNTNNQK